MKRASFGIEHAATGWMQLRANYFVQHTSDVYRAINPNAPINGVRPDASLGNVTFVDAIGREESQGVDLSMNLNYAPKRIFGTINYRLGEDDERRRQRDQPAGQRRQPRWPVGPVAQRRAAPHLRLRHDAAAEGASASTPT